MMKSQTRKPRIGIAVADPAGIGPEITCKSLKNLNVLEKCHPVIIGNYDLLENCAKQVAPELELHKSDGGVTDMSHPSSPCQAIEVIDVEITEPIPSGEASAVSGEMIHRSLKQAFDLLRKGLLDGMVMAPITKQSLSLAEPDFHSEYELFASLANVEEVKSVVKGRNVFRSTAIGHVPFREIVERLTTEEIIKTGVQLHDIMRRFEMEKPRLGVAALNPHAGEYGLLGDEEEKIIEPAILSLRENGIQASGPFPADTIFISAIRGEFDGVLFLYHDQGNIAMKTAYFGEGVVIYTGTPYVIISTRCDLAISKLFSGLPFPSLRLV
jgi:4-hydroxy-L-threonine phosphate dehydrogenase PdxA